MRNWAVILPEMLCLICKHVDSLKDLAAFGGVCSTWRLVAVEHNFGHPLLPLPWLMLAENQHDEHRDFYSLTEDKTYSFKLSELRGKKCMETKGWIVTVSENRDMALVHPLKHVEIPLPRLDMSRYEDDREMDSLVHVQRVVLSSPHFSKNNRDCVLMISYGSFGQLGFCRPGDKVWTDIEFLGYAIWALEHYRGKFYVATTAGEVWEYDVIGNFKNDGPVLPRRIEVNFLSYLIYAQPYLVDSAGSLLVVIRNGIYIEKDGNYGPSGFCLLEVDVEQGGFEEVRSLGTRAIFLGHSAGMSVDTIWYPELIANSIYFTDDCDESYLDEPEGGGMNMGVYNLEDKNVQPHYSGKSLSLVCPPVWTFLSTK